MSLVGQKRRFDAPPTASGLPQSTDIIRPAQLVRLVPLGDSCTAINNIFTRSTHPPAQAEFFGQAINQLLVPFTCEEGDDLGAPIDEFRPAPPAAILSISE